jgi:8-oxo-dGTP pyrophosphatase MutT (NUDIX family)
VSDSFRIDGTTELLQSHVFKVERRRVVHHNETFERDVATHPGAVAILVIDNDGAIGLIRQYRATFDSYTWEIPAGTQDIEGEEPLHAAKRELKEEMGCTASRWTLLGRFMNSPGWTNQVMTIFEARDLEIGERNPAGPEEDSSTIHWLLPADLRKVLRGEPAVDSTMAVALNRVFGTFFDRP